MESIPTPLYSRLGSSISLDLLTSPCKTVYVKEAEGECPTEAK